jgi:hypothetical protein
MSISFGPKLNLLYNALIGESYFDSLRLFLQNIDALLQGSVINATQAAPPVSPNPGDAYLLTGGTPSGVWTGKAGQIAFWDAQLTTSGTNTVAPGWVFLVPQAGWIIWNIAAATLIVFNGTSWSPVQGGANFPTNTDITSMTGIPNTTINNAGYIFNDGTAADTVTLASTGITWGSNFNTGLIGATIANQTWAGASYTGIGLGINSGSGGSLIGAGFIGTDALTTTQMLCTTVGTFGSIQCSFIEADAPSGAIAIAGRGTSQVGVQIQAGSTPHQLLLGFSFYPVQTTVGAAGSASALPALPSGYLPIVIGTTEYVIPYYAAA